MKSEPDVFSFDDLKKKYPQSEPWEGVRNYQARNFMKDQMKKGDLVLFYHSNANPPGIKGLAMVTSESYPDSSAFDIQSKYYDSKSTPDNPRWFLVDVIYYQDFKRMVALEELKSRPELREMKVVQKGQRLSVQPVDEDHFKLICNMAGIGMKDF